MEAQWRVICTDLRRRIVAGEWAVGDRLPPIKDLQDEYEAQSLNTVRSAQQALVEEGLLETHQGRGAFVISLTPLEGPRLSGERGSHVDHAVALGLRIEFYDADGHIHAAALREDVRGAGVPRVGDRLGPASLGKAVHDVAGLYVDVAAVEHHLVMGASLDAPLAVAVARVNATPAPQDLTALEEAGWSLSVDLAADAGADAERATSGAR